MELNENRSSPDRTCSLDFTKSPGGCPPKNFSVPSLHVNLKMDRIEVELRTGWLYHRVCCLLAEEQRSRKAIWTLTNTNFCHTGCVIRNKSLHRPRSILDFHFAAWNLRITPNIWHVYRLRHKWMKRPNHSDDEACKQCRKMDTFWTGSTS